MRYQLVRDLLLCACCIVLGYSLGQLWFTDEAHPVVRSAKRQLAPSRAADPSALRWHDGGWPVWPFAPGAGLIMPSAVASGLTPSQCTVVFTGVPDEFPSSIEPNVIYRGFSGMNQTVVCTAGANGYPYNWFAGRVTLPIEFSYSYAPGVWYPNGPTVFDIEARWTGLSTLEINYANLSGVVHDAGGWCAASLQTATSAGPFNMTTGNPQNIPGFPAWPTPIPAGAVTISAWA